FGSFESREAAEYLSPGREPWVRRPSPRLRHPSPARAGEGKGEREGAPTHGFTPWATLCRSFGADFCWELRLQGTSACYYMLVCLESRHRTYRRVQKGAGRIYRWVEDLPGANTQGATLEEARENLREAIRLVLEGNRGLAERDLEGEDTIK